MRRKKEKVEKNHLTEEILSVISPMGIEFKKNSITIGENEGSVFTILKYPVESNYGWLSQISKLKSTMFMANYSPTDGADIIEAINSDIKHWKYERDNANDESERKEAEYRVKDLNNLLDRISRDDESVGFLTSSFLIYGSDKEEVEKNERKFISKAKEQRIKVRKLSNIQKDAYTHMLPSYLPRKKIDQIGKRIMPLSSFLGGMPFSSCGHFDEMAYICGVDEEGKPVAIDYWKRSIEDGRTNSNIVMMGLSGTGKSTNMKNIIYEQYLNGTKIIIIDPESEYSEMVENLGGDVILAGNGKKTISPLDVRTAMTDESEEINPLTLHMKNLETFFSLYLTDFSTIEMAILKEKLITAYKNKGIDFDSNFENIQDYPSFLDIYNLFDEENSEDEKRIKTRLRDISMGSDSYIWGEKTNVDISADIISFDTKHLSHFPKNIKSAQYYNILTFAWQIISKNKTEKIMLVADEAYTIIDKDVPQALEFLRNISKRIRKYEGMLAVISHDVIDFLSPSVRQYGQAVLETPTYKFLFGTEGTNLEETKKLYKLTDKEEELLSRKMQRNCLCFIGNKRHHLNLKLPDHRINIFGSGGGR